MTTTITDDRATRFPKGNAITLEELRRNPLGLTRELLYNEPVTWVPDMGMWMVSKHHLVKELYQAPERFIKNFNENPEKAHGDSMLSLDEPQHAESRGPFNRPFRPPFIQKNLSGMIDDHVHGVLDASVGTQGADLVDEHSFTVAARVVSDGLGFHFPDDDYIEALIEAFMKALQYDADDAARDAFDRKRSELIPAVLEALESKRNTVLGTFNERRPDGYTDEMVILNVMNLILGGVETTATVISTSVWALLSHPETLAEVRADRSLVLPAVREALRLNPVFGYNIRVAAVDTELGGVQIKAGEKVFPLLLPINRDPEVFETPDVYDIHRGDARQALVFGTGIHSCIGQHLALAIGVAYLNAALDRLVGLRLDPASPSEPTHFENHHLLSLRVIWDEVRPR